MDLLFTVNLWHAYNFLYMKAKEHKHHPIKNKMFKNKGENKNTFPSDYNIGG